MAESTIAERMKDCLVRQVAWFKRVLADMETFDEDLTEAQLGKLDRQRQTHLRGTAEIIREFEVLAVEWHTSTNVADHDRKAVHELALETEAFANRLKETYDRADIRVQRRLTDWRQTWNALQRGRDMLRKYAPGQADEAAFVDRKI